MKPVITTDTRRLITSSLENAGQQYGLDPVFLLAGAIAESGLAEQASREQAWPDVSYGLWQPSVAFLGNEVTGLTRDESGEVQDTPANREIARNFCWDAETLTAYVVPLYKKLLDRWGTPLEAWCRWNAPGIEGSQNLNRPAYERALAEAEMYRGIDRVQGGAMNDVRGSLPTRPEESYNTRPLDGIQGVTLHYTAGPPSQTVLDIANYQISAAAAPQTGTGRPFPGIAYTAVVTEDGVWNLCWDLETRVWHSAAMINGLSRNLTYVGICYTGNVGPNQAQVHGLAEAIHWVEGQLGRTLSMEGHRDAPYATTCPGPAWPGWRPAVEQELTALRGGPPLPGPLAVGQYFTDFLTAHPEWGKPRLDEASFPGGSALWTTPTAAHPKGGLLVYRTWLKEVRGVSWD